MLQVFDERNRDLIVNVGGRLTHRDQAAVSPFDSAVQGGDAVWEGLRLYDGKVFRLDEHVERLYRSAKAIHLQIPQSPEEMRSLLLERGPSPCRSHPAERGATSGDDAQPSRRVRP